MGNEQKHTALPWHIAGNLEDEIPWIRADNVTGLIANCDYSSGLTKEEKYANAAFIVLAVNNYEKLVGVIKDLLERIDLNGGLGEYKGGKAFIVKDAKALLTELEKSDVE